ncbi:AAA domain-containing protein [Nocardia sp. NPDC057668]|uniref:AAA domain-containing protein n=1 Tax=Nocardia sp. NPDC057668 TaxID=3346202 RepID=UPI00366EBC2F
MGDSDDRARILRYWRAVEYFSPARVDSVDHTKGVRRVERGRPLPWDIRAKPHEKLKKNHVWRHTVYLGVYELRRMREVLDAVLRSPEEETDFDARAGGQSAILSLTVSESGLLVRDSVSLSSCAWAIGRTVDPGPGSDQWLVGLDTAQRAIMAVAVGIGDGVVRVVEPANESPSALDRIVGAAARIGSEISLGALESALEGALTPVVGSLVAQLLAGIGVKATRDAAPGAADADLDAETRDEPPVLGTKPLGAEDLVALTEWLIDALGVREALCPAVIRVKSRQVHRDHADDASGDEFLNSFYADDLSAIATAAEAGDIGSALAGYLKADAAIDVGDRVDVRAAPRAVLRALGPTAMPPGRWPADPGKPLTLSQQFAVNEIHRTLGDSGARGLFAVNGPPGTGKTTLLRDLIAGIVVERATRLAELEHPRKAFEDKARTWRTGDTGGYSRTLTPLIADLCGFEMVVASSNNGAVENITLEVPSIDAIDAEAFPEAEYLSAQASLLTGAPAWAGIAARLGRRSFRSDFVSRLWWGDTDSGEPSEDGLKDLLQGFAEYAAAGEQLEGLLTWEEAVAEFDAARAEVGRLAQERQRIADLLARREQPDPDLVRLRRQISDRHELGQQMARHRASVLALAEAGAREHARTLRDLAAAQDRLGEAVTHIERAGRWVTAAEHDLRVYDRTRPGFFKRLFSRGSDTEWEAERSPLLAKRREADEALLAADRFWSGCRAAVHECQRAVDEAVQALRTAHAKLAAVDRDLREATLALSRDDNAVRAREAVLRREDEELAAARERWTRMVPGPEWDADPGERAAMELREKSSPWMDEEFAAARSRLFLAALELHYAVLTSEPKLLRNSLFGVMDVVRGDAPSGLPAETVRAAWQLLFFVVPVISTTFASLARMFGNLGRESLGWLFIDEAGQAAPQEAVGALWRTQRAVVVGDPRQLEPVVALPWSGQQRLCRQFGVDPRWAPTGSSVQSIADRLNTFGTWLPDPQGLGQLWVGSPLRVHRRCDRLMFEVSNDIAYDGLMVYGVSPRHDFALLNTNTWLDVPAQMSGEKWNPAEGQYVLATLNLVRGRIREIMDQELADSFSEEPDWAESDQSRAAELSRRVAEAVFIVSPFRDVVYGLQSALGSRLPPKPKRVGTVHTTQGKEADIVILVLGTATAQGGSRDWAAQTPNLLNVAVTRAKQRLVVVGDYRNWSGRRHFRSLAQRGVKTGDGLLKIVDAAEWSVRNASGVDWKRYDG